MKKHLLLLLLLASAPAVAALSKWVDENGEVHYSDQPPVNVKTLRSASTPPAIPASGVAAASAPAAAKTYVEREAELKKAQKAKQEAADKAAQEQKQKDDKKANCAAAQQNLRTLQEGTRMVEVDANGERSYLDDTQREQRIAKAQQDIGNWCK
ncbi:MAG TPA: DUF4124 domain-containing protein [Gallionella sp.]|nr:DUF4124 domain-containing protein [Gallionella sp.]